MTNASVSWPGGGSEATLDRPPVEGRASVRDVVVAQFGFIWRLLRHLGVSASEVDDATQQVFLIASSKLGAVEPGRERSFLYGVALRIAAKTRQAEKRRAAADTESFDLPDPSWGPEELLDSARKRALFDEALAAMDLDLRAIFVLHELERLTMHEIATTLDVPNGTVASRLRRARADFRERVLRIDARLKARGGLR